MRAAALFFGASLMFAFVYSAQRSPSLPLEVDKGTPAERDAALAVLAQTTGRPIPQGTTGAASSAATQEGSDEDTAAGGAEVEALPAEEDTGEQATGTDAQAVGRAEGQEPSDQ